MKKRKILAGCLLIPALLASGCGKDKEEPQTPPSTDKIYLMNETLGEDEYAEPLTKPVGVTSFVEDPTNYINRTGNQQNTETIRILYRKLEFNRDYSNYVGWRIWAWDSGNGGNGNWYEFTKYNDYGVICDIPVSEVAANGTSISKMGIVLTNCNSPTTSWGDATNSYSKDPDSDLFVSVSPTNINGVQLAYCKGKSKTVYYDQNSVFMSSLDYCYYKSPSIIRAVFVTQDSNFLPHKGRFTVKINGEIVNDYVLENVTSTGKGVDLKFANRVIKASDDVEVSYKISEQNVCVKRSVISSRYYDSEEFTNKYNYSGNDLGVTFDNDETPTKTTFKVWSPVSTKMVLRIYNSSDYRTDTEPVEEKEMILGEKGVFAITLDGDYTGKYYTYVVTNAFHHQAEVVDPYAKSAGVNGLRGMIVNFEKANPIGFKNIEINPINPKHLTIYETHIADLTSSKTWTTNKKIRKFEKTFVGAQIEGTTYQENGKTVSTGFDHIKELGVNAVELLPIFDQANDELNPSFNWGYNPINYNVLEGAYSTKPKNGYTRIFEFKQLVKKYHDAGINIIMDVVFNHMNGAPGSNFDVIMPGYYFRYHRDGTLSNGSGCGNETASELPMMRKFMIDSVMFFAKEYKLGGFRFDLMGLHDLKTMEKLAESLHKFNKNIVIFGEPWCGGGSTLPFRLSCNQANVPLFNGYGAFNDKIRETLVHLACEPTYSGWIGNSKYLPDEGEIEQVKAAIKGTIFGMGEGFDDPNTQVNYVTCHDNHTMYDKLIASNFRDEAEIKKVSMMAHSIVFTSNGISFMLAGEEFLRSKKGVENSYSSSYEINELDYSLKIKNLDMFKNFQKLIKFKQEVYELALEKGLNTLVDVESDKGNMISYELADKDTNRIYKIFHVNGFRNGGANIVDLSGYKIYLDTINSHKVLGSKTSLVPYETLICYKERNE